MKISEVWDLALSKLKLDYQARLDPNDIEVYAWAQSSRGSVGGVCTTYVTALMGPQGDACVFLNDDYAYYVNNTFSKLEEYYCNENMPLLDEVAEWEPVSNVTLADGTFLPRATVSISHAPDSSCDEVISYLDSPSNELESHRETTRKLLASLPDVAKDTELSDQQSDDQCQCGKPNAPNDLSCPKCVRDSLYKHLDPFG